jgi:hypothetical protein
MDKSKTQRNETKRNEEQRIQANVLLRKCGEITVQDLSAGMLFANSPVGGRNHAAVFG